MTLSRSALALALLVGCTRSGEVLREAGGASGTSEPPVVLQTSEARLATGDTHACRVKGGVLSCWGENADGQLGVPTSGGSTEQSPQQAPGTNWVAPAAGDRHSCALAADGSISCWGKNDKGQLGSGDFSDSTAPRRVVLPARAVDVRSEFEHTCAVLADASIMCWGANEEGQLGLGDTYPGADQPSPVAVGDAHDWVFVSAGQGHSCGIRGPGALYCWGRNSDSQLGQGSGASTQIRTPTRVGADEDWVEVGCAQGSTCARKRDDSLYCWGHLESGVLAVGDVALRATPTRVPNYTDWTALTTNTFHTCGLRATGEVWCAGRNTEGQLGSMQFADALPNMQRLDASTDWVEVRAGRFFTCARKGNDSVWCVGQNSARQLGQPASIDRSAVLLEVP